ncbi:TetR family transcriptional regulator [Bifidobacterium aemilianum]|uniref:TetR family transcriptional regulator n=1 Tax=Bifidobacterium aemilianum TaxID=2493120 RepID=A0A366K9V7_9BIFI|nr:TetR/AcrR family transcriptional regulator [Bifidobacterium aemilianum]RBP97441.1 TetR family transcriptional regulator [Bifidobacterium aemilianum]
MGTQKDPEGHRKRILDVAQRLFLEKGYDGTSIGDIVDGLGGMTKGAIYYHFPSKSSIFEAVTERMADDDFLGQDWRADWPGNSGLEKLRNELVISLRSYSRHEVVYSAQAMLKSPRMVGEMYLNSMDRIAKVIGPYIQEGIEDGSIEPCDPDDVAEVLFLLLNMWIGLRLTAMAKEEVARKFRLLKTIFDGIGVPVIDEGVIQAAVDLYGGLQGSNRAAGKA